MYSAAGGAQEGAGREGAPHSGAAQPGRRGAGGGEEKSASEEIQRDHKVELLRNSRSMIQLVQKKMIITN